MKIGNYIKEKRIQRGLTQEELALKSDITVRTIQRIESGEVDPRSYTLQSIAAVLEVEFDELVSIDKETSEAAEKEKLKNNESFWLAALHASGALVLFIPFITTLVIWTLKKDEISSIRSHAIDSINFQISMFIYLVIGAFLCMIVIGIPIVILLGIYIMVIPIINAAKAANDQPYRYRFVINFLKK
jgi:transcriptional regulator with XRE-family HTH domain